MTLWGIKRYNHELSGRLPSLELRGLLKDLILHMQISPSSERHIFVVGPPRSGTTLVRGVVSAHSKIATTDLETFFFNRRRTSLFSSEEIPEFQEMLAHAKSKVELFDKIAEKFRSKHHAEFFLEKTPEHALVLSHLLKWYPRSKFIFVVRDGRDAFSSSFRNPQFNYKVGVEYPRLWRDSVRSYLRNKDAPNMKLLRYESLVKEPRQNTEELMGFLNISFEDGQLDPQQYSQTSMAREAGHENLSIDINDSSVGAFRSRLTTQQIDYFVSLAGPELRAMNYSF